MKKIIAATVIALAPVVVFSQVMDDASIKKLEKGEYKIESGKIQVTFADTVSPGFIESKLDELGYEILSSNIQNIILSIEGNPSAQQLMELEDSEWVEFVMSEAAGNSDQEPEQINQSDSLAGEEVNQLLAKLNHSKKDDFVIVALTYNSTEESIEEIKVKFPDLEFTIAEKSERTAILKTEENRELEVMDELKKFAFVKNTAMVGNLD